MPLMFELFGARTGNCHRAAIAAEESGLPFEVRQVDLIARAHRSPSFLALNPAGKVPVLIDRRDTPIVITQSNAILMHLAEAAPERLIPATTVDARARILERFFYFVTDVISPNFSAFHIGAGGERTAAAALTKLAVANFEATERFVEDGFMAGDRFSIVDIAAVTIATSLQQSINWTARPKLRDWFERVSDWPSVRRGMRTFGVSG